MTIQEIIFHHLKLRFLVKIIISSALSGRCHKNCDSAFALSARNRDFKINTKNIFHYISPVGLKQKKQHSLKIWFIAFLYDEVKRCSTCTFVFIATPLFIPGPRKTVAIVGTERKKHVFSLSFFKHTQKIGAEINVIALSARHPWTPFHFFRLSYANTRRRLKRNSACSSGTKNCLMLKNGNFFWWLFHESE